MTRGTLIACAACAVAAGLTLIDFRGNGMPRVAAGQGGSAAATVSSADRSPHAPPRPGEVRQMTVKELGNFTYDPAHGAGIPDDVRGLSGMTVRLTGFMIPMDQSEHMTRFTLVPSLFSCCYGKPPEIQHIVAVQCQSGKTADYSADPIAVTGKLDVKESIEDGYVVSLYSLTCSGVTAAPK